MARLRMYLAWPVLLAAYGCELTLTEPAGESVLSIVVSPARATIKCRNGIQLTATAPGDSSQLRVSWFSTNTEIAEVSSFGWVTSGAAIGETTVFAKNDAGVTGEAIITVRDAVDSITVAPNRVSLSVGQSTILRFTAWGEGGKAIPERFSWTSDNPKVSAPFNFSNGCILGQSGWVCGPGTTDTAVAVAGSVGTTTIRVFAGCKSATVELTVTPRE